MKFRVQQVLRTDFDSLIEVVLAAERVGFAAVWTPDHFHVAPDAGAPAVGIAESWTTLAALAARTERIRVGGAVMCNLFRHPCLTAQIAATVDRVSHGRLDLGLGAGWMGEEFRRIGVTLPPPGPRVDMLAEALEIVLPALEGKRVTFRGEHYNVSEFAVFPGAVQTPRPPLHLGGGADRLLRLAARVADLVSVMPVTRGGTLRGEDVAAFDGDRMAERIRFLRREAAEMGRDPASIDVVDFVSLARVCQDARQTDRTLDAMGRMYGMETEEVRRHPMALVGTPDEIVEMLEDRQERWGIDSVLLPSSTNAPSAEAFGLEVLPRVSSSGRGG